MSSRSTTVTPAHFEYLAARTRGDDPFLVERALARLRTRLGAGGVRVIWGDDEPARLQTALPIYVVFFATIAFCIYFPEVVLWLPKQVLPASVGCFQSPSGTGLICPQG